MCFFQVMPAAFTDDEAFLEPSESQSDRKTSLSISNLDILNVNQLLESVRQNLHLSLNISQHSDHSERFIIFQL